MSYEPDEPTDLEPTSSFDLAPRVRPSLLPTAGETERIAKLANLLAHTEFVPSALRGNPPAILAAVLTGRELGIMPMRALRQIAIVEGKPTPAAELMVALALRAGHDLFVAETTHESCTVEVRRSDWPEDRVGVMTWDLTDALRAGLIDRIDEETGRPIARSRRGNPLPWETYTRAMLRSRCVSEAARTWLPDVVEGFSYTPEELGADVDANGQATELTDLPGYEPMGDVPEELREQVEEAMEPEESVEVHDDECRVTDTIPTEPQRRDPPRPLPEEARNIVAQPTLEHGERSTVHPPSWEENLEEHYALLHVPDVRALLEHGSVTVEDDDGELVELELPVPPMPQGFAAVDRLEGEAGRGYSGGRRKGVDEALAAHGWEPRTWDLDGHGPVAIPEERDESDGDEPESEDEVPTPEEPPTDESGDVSTASGDESGDEEEEELEPERRLIRYRVRVACHLIRHLDERPGVEERLRTKLGLRVGADESGWATEDVDRLRALARELEASAMSLGASACSADHERPAPAIPGNDEGLCAACAPVPF